MSEREDRYRMSLRVFMVFLGYVVYRVVGHEELGAGVMAGAGAVVVGFRLADRIAGPRRGAPLERSEAALALAGAGLIALGVFLGSR